MKANKLSLLLLPLILTGCAGVDPERPAFDALGGVGAGGVAYEVTKNPLIAAGAGAGGVLVTDVAQQMISSGDAKKQAEFYAKGQSDATKELYWSHERMTDQENSDLTARVAQLEKAQKELEAKLEQARATPGAPASKT
jgi:hypothetical protein